MSNIKAKGERLKAKGLFYLLSVFLFQLSFSSCNPNAHWETANVDIYMSIQTVSAGFVECNFSTNKDAYYLIAIQEPEEDYDPMQHQKQFMMMALDSANTQYILWRHSLLKEGVFSVAPFSSHSLQYGAVNHFFTGLLPDTDYWIYAFVVNPETMLPAGKLHLVHIKTTKESVMDVHFDYRVKGSWDYIYPLDKENQIQSHFPYIATTRDSLEFITEEGFVDPTVYYVMWMLNLFLTSQEANVYYGVKAMLNDGINSHTVFEPGHTYYTAIGGFDGSFKQTTIYKFRWEGEDTQYYFTDEDNLVSIGKDE